MGSVGSVGGVGGVGGMDSMDGMGGTVGMGSVDGMDGMDGMDIAQGKARVSAQRWGGTGQGWGRASRLGPLTLPAGGNQRGISSSQKRGVEQVGTASCRGHLDSEGEQPGCAGPLHERPVCSPSPPRLLVSTASKAHFCHIFPLFGFGAARGIWQVRSVAAAARAEGRAEPTPELSSWAGRFSLRKCWGMCTDSWLWRKNKRSHRNCPVCE